MCPFASDSEVVYVTVVPPLCCPLLRLKVLLMVLPVSPEPPEPTATTVFESPSPKFQVYSCVAEKLEFAPGFVAVLLVNVTGNPDVDSSLMPLIVEEAVEYSTVCVE